VTALDRANAFLKNRAVKLALTVILLGIFAGSAAQAATVSYNLCQEGDPGTCLFSQTLQLVVIPDSTPSGLSAPETNFTASPDAAGGVVLVGGFGLTADVAGDYSFLLDLSGNTAGVPLGTNGVAGYYDGIIDPGAGGILGALTQFTVTQNSLDYSADVTVAGPGHGTGNCWMGPLYADQTVTNWDVQFSFNWIANAGDSLSVEFPLTLDPTPEPVSVLLVGSGIGLLALLRRWRRA
jgi:hypothetical protein